MQKSLIFFTGNNLVDQKIDDYFNAFIDKSSHEK